MTIFVIDYTKGCFLIKNDQILWGKDLNMKVKASDILAPKSITSYFSGNS